MDTITSNLDTASVFTNEFLYSIWNFFAANLSERTRKNYYNIVRGYIRITGHNPDELTHSDADKYFNELVTKMNAGKLSRTTAIMRLSVMKSLCDYIQYKNNKLYVNGKYVKEPFLNSDVKTNDFDIIDLMITSFIPKDSYLVLGDNRENSTDSRVFGFVKKDDILGTTVFSIFPFTKFGTI